MLVSDVKMSNKQLRSRVVELENPELGEDSDMKGAQIETFGELCEQLCSQKELQSETGHSAVDKVVAKTEPALACSESQTVVSDGALPSFIIIIFLSSIRSIETCYGC
jgi:hypothetical protein